MSSVPTDPDCIFCKIVKGSIPCSKLYEDEHVIAFLDINPVADGHALIVPKAHYVTLPETPGAVAGACMSVAPKIADAILKAVGVEAFNILQNNGKAAGQAVMHVHFHIIPRKPTERGQFHYSWPAQSLDATRRDELIKIVTSELAKSS
eukprot:CAMPEP_0184646168 /NCGR_PEP_ID=MMETSP0308-20130426/2804_1 /TAXON_ID=38269 /ORGANISM="Gloeochaete witrockiana, Strain SAG 46.84" /LENGTH=148 /DNA_ID=CAMNT_0027075901 /DNA_START=237 /DNA_END=683 /DNA_ORIENTATION=-